MSLLERITEIESILAHVAVIATHKFRRMYSFSKVLANSRRRGWIDILVDSRLSNIMVSFKFFFVTKLKT